MQTRKPKSVRRSKKPPIPDEKMLPAIDRFLRTREVDFTENWSQRTESLRPLMRSLDALNRTAKAFHEALLRVEETLPRAVVSDGSSASCRPPDYQMPEPYCLGSKETTHKTRKRHGLEIPSTEQLTAPFKFFKSITKSEWFKTLMEKYYSLHFGLRHEWNTIKCTWRSTPDGQLWPDLVRPLTHSRKQPDLAMASLAAELALIPDVLNGTHRVSAAAVARLMMERATQGSRLTEWLSEKDRGDIELQRQIRDAIKTASRAGISEKVKSRTANFGPPGEYVPAETFAGTWKEKFPPPVRKRRRKAKR